MSDSQSKFIRTTDFQDTLTRVPNGIATILEEYSGIKRDDQAAHILAVRNKAYKLHPYPCLGRFRFLELDLSNHPIYHSHVLPIMKADTTPAPLFLELGTCLGQDLRKLVLDGVPADRCWGTDIIPEFIDSGYELFGDGEKLKRDNFIAPADLFDVSGGSLAKLDGRCDIIHATAVFHLFGLEKQKAIARRCLRLLKTRPGNGKGLVIGGQAGNVEGGEFTRKGGDGISRYRHNTETWRKMWEDICREDEWRDKVKKLDVSGNLEERTAWGNQQGQMNGENAQSEQSKVTGGENEEGFRWQTFEVWVEFK